MAPPNTKDPLGQPEGDRSRYVHDPADVERLIGLPPGSLSLPPGVDRLLWALPANLTGRQQRTLARALRRRLERQGRHDVRVAFVRPTLAEGGGA
jgi:hypothetical protein